MTRQKVVQLYNLSSACSVFLLRPFVFIKTLHGSFVSVTTLSKVICRLQILCDPSEYSVDWKHLCSYLICPLFHLFISCSQTAVWWEDQGLQRGWIAQSEYQQCSVSDLCSCVFSFNRPLMNYLMQFRGCYTCTDELWSPLLQVVW